MRQIEGVTLYTILEAAKTLQVTPQTVRSYIKSGLLRAQRVGRPYLISGESLKLFVTGGAVQVEPQLKNGVDTTRILPQ